MRDLDDRELESCCAGKDLVQDARNTMAALRTSVNRVASSAEGLNKSGSVAAASLENASSDFRKMFR